MSDELISILVLVVVFVIATTRSIDVGALSFAAFGVGELGRRASARTTSSPGTRAICSWSWSG
ncbi:hypothetical protein SANTM175S_07871 [Streptomyces antimycoticus]